MVATVYLDVTELTSTPLRSGIQRVERELIRHWPGPATLQPCCFSRQHRNFRSLPSEVFEILLNDGTGHRDPLDDQRARLAPLLSNGKPLNLYGSNILLNTELFFDASRANAYINLAADGFARVCWLIFDFIPWLCPEYFPSGLPKHCMHYLRALRAVSNVSFISKTTSTDYASRIKRGFVGGNSPVLRLGGDGLGVERQSFAPTRVGFLCWGTITPRKNVDFVIEAFEHLNLSGSAASLVLAGRIEPHAEVERRAIARLTARPWFRFVDHPSDNKLRDLLRQARATIFVSEGEGFGIPPYESLFASIPVIVASSLPSLDGLPSYGQIRLPVPINVESVVDAVARLSDDNEAACLWEEASRLNIPTWRDFARATSEWVQSV